MKNLNALETEVEFVSFNSWQKNKELMRHLIRVFFK